MQIALSQVTSSDQAGVAASATRLETAWDDAQPRLQPMDGTAWTYIDAQIDDALTAVRASHPDTSAERLALTRLATTFG